jgi:hypothetical protein
MPTKDNLNDVPVNSELEAEWKGCRGERWCWWRGGGLQKGGWYRGVGCRYYGTGAYLTARAILSSKVRHMETYGRLWKYYEV